MDERYRIFAPLDMADSIDPPGQLTYTPLDNTCRRIPGMRMRKGEMGQGKDTHVHLH